MTKDSLSSPYFRRKSWCVMIVLLLII